MPIFGALTGLLLFSGVAVPSGSPAPIVAPSYTVAMTAYNAVPAQTDNDPLWTAAGAFSNPETIAARSRDLADELPFGTIIEIDGPTGAQGGCGYDAVSDVIGYRIIADTMAARFTNRIDVLFDTKPVYKTAAGMKNAAQVMGLCRGVTIRVVGRLTIDDTHPGRLPKTQAELAALVENGNSGSLAIK